MTKMMVVEEREEETPEKLSVSSAWGDMDVEKQTEKAVDEILKNE